MKNIFLLLLTVFLLSACVKDANNVNLPEIDPKLVTQSFLTEDEDNIIVYLTWSSPIFGTFDYDFETVKNADVFVSNNGNKIKLNYYSDSNKHESYYTASAASLTMKSGEKFDLEITDSTGNKVTSTTIIPEKPIYSAKLISMDSALSQYDDKEYSYHIEFQGNNSNDINYYYPIIIGYGHYYSNQQDSVVLRDNSRNSPYVKANKGETINLVFDSYMLLDSMKFIVLHTDEAYYYYHKSIYNFDGGDNPFSEPVIIYSNIENGLGVFCSYNTDIQKIPIK